MAESLTRAQAEEFATEHGGAIERQLIKVPVDVVRVPDYSCDRCKAGEHDRCSPRVYLTDWQFDCGCAQEVPHTRYGDVLVVPLAQEAAS